MVDFDRGLVSFYNANKLICSHKDTFTETILPYITVGKAAIANTKDIRICHYDISTSLEYKGTSGDGQSTQGQGESIVM